VSQDGNILPWGRSPVWVVISLLRALVPVSVSIVVLASIRGLISDVSLLLSVCNEETLVSRSGVACSPVRSWLVHSVQEVSASIGGSGSIDIIGDGIGGGSISYSLLSWVILVAAHVLNNHVAIHLWILSTAVLVGPFNGEQRALIEIHRGTPAVATLAVVLRVEQSVAIVSVLIGLVQSVVGATRILHV